MLVLSSLANKLSSYFEKSCLFQKAAMTFKTTPIHVEMMIFLK